MERVDEEAPTTEENILTTTPDYNTMSQDINTSKYNSKQKFGSIDVTASGMPSARALTRENNGGLMPIQSAKGLIPVNSLNDSVGS